jgi:hypothetical protein
LLRYRVLPASFLVFLLTACGGNKTTSSTGSTTPPNSPPTSSTPATPVFTSTPNTQATEGSLYSYQLAATGTGVTFSLSNAPAGATLTGSTVSWTPTAQQSRSTPNNFTVTANAPGAPSATQSWAVTPNGTITINHVDTVWNENGPTTKPFDWSTISSSVAALVPQPDGSFQSLSGTAGANGTFEIPNVPAGYFWLRLGPRDTYWTGSSTFDVGSDIFIPSSVPGVAPVATVSFNFNFTSLDPTPASGLLQIDSLEAGLLPYSASTDAGSTTFTAGTAIYGNLDYSGIKTLFVRQYEPTSFGSVNGYFLGPELTLTNQTLTNSGLNTVSGSLNPTATKSINLSVQGSAWAQLFAHIAPTAPTATGGAFFLSVQPFVAADGPNISSSNPAMPIDLIKTKANVAPTFSSGSCPASQYPSLTTNVEAGTVSYNDPFPAAWRRTFRVCQGASVIIPLPGGSTQTFNLTNTQTTSLPTATVQPLISGVQNPKVNGADLFTAGTANSKAVILSWDPPATGTPFGYNVSIVSPTTLPSGQVAYLISATLGTAKTSVTIPPDLLRAGQTYLFVITSLMDGNANMEMKPHRSLLPVGSADVISAPITTQ